LGNAGIASILRFVAAAALFFASVIIILAIVAGELGYAEGRYLASAVVIFLGSALVIMDTTYPQGRRQQILGQVGVVTTLIAFVLCFLLIRSDIQTNRYVWKAWWLFSIISVHIAHVLAVLRARTEPKAFLVVRNITLGAAFLFAAILVGMTFRSDVLATPGTFVVACLYLLGATSVLGSVVLWIWARPQRGVVRLPGKAVRAAWWVAIPVLVFAAGFYLGRVTTPPAGALDHATGLLAGLPPDSIDEQIGSDLATLRVIADGLDQLRHQAPTLYAKLVARRSKDGVAVFAPEEDDEIRALFFSFLSYRAALFRMMAFYQGFEGVSDIKQRSRCFLTGYAAGSICYDASLLLVSAFQDDELVRKKLNEADARWGIPASMFDQIRQGVALDRNVRLFEEMTAYYQTHPDRWRNCGLTADESQFLQDEIDRALTAIKQNPAYGKDIPLLSAVIDKVKDDAYTPVYAVQSVVSTWIGDTRLISRPACISQAQVERIRAQLQPGDIILERRNWFLSNAFLPGFWPHAAMYVGTHEDLKRLGLTDKPAIRDRLDEYLSLAHDGEPRVVIESISEGVSFSSLGEATRADYIAVLRPRLSDTQKADAILCAFAHQGKPYDFEFDFFSSDKLVCTELVYRSYEGSLHFELKKIMGRMTLPAVELANKYRNEKDDAERELDFVLFLDTPPGGSEAVFVDEQAFIESADRPRAFNE